MRFEDVYSINVNDKTERKGNLTYLSWAWAWAEFKKCYPDAAYEIWRDERGLPYVHDPDTGFMVFTTVTAGGVTHEMWLPVMDARNKAMLECTMFDVNKTIMRCLTKNLAMFGLGLYIYAGEDLPENTEPTSSPEQRTKNAEPTLSPEQRAKILHELNRTGIGKNPVARNYGVLAFEDIPASKFEEIMASLKEKPDKA